MRPTIDADIRFKASVGPDRRLKRDGWRPVFTAAGIEVGSSAVVTFKVDSVQRAGEVIPAGLELICPETVEPALRRGTEFYLS